VILSGGAGAGGCGTGASGEFAISGGCPCFHVGCAAGGWATTTDTSPNVVRAVSATSTAVNTLERRRMSRMVVDLRVRGDVGCLDARTLIPCGARCQSKV
jgi:hypothetical protein